MKFLCVGCDEAMKLKETKGPNEGSFCVVFSCSVCGSETAMLTNSMETQMVRSLGVKIGGRQVPAEPMEMVRHSLLGGVGASGEAPSSDEASGSKCPFSGVIADAYGDQENAAPIVWTKEALDRIDRIPEFAQPMARKGIELHAREHGYTKIDNAVVDQVKTRFGM